MLRKWDGAIKYRRDWRKGSVIEWYFYITRDVYPLRTLLTVPVIWNPLNDDALHFPRYARKSHFGDYDELHKKLHP